MSEREHRANAPGATVSHAPNFIFIGPDKSGSTWIYEVLRAQPGVFVPSSKELFFFDRYHHLGPDWYFSHFQAAGPEHRIRAELSHDYLYSPEAAARLASLLPSAQLMACLREPVERAFSSYLYMVRQGRVRGSFSEAIDTVDELVEHGLYARHLKAYLAHYPREQMHIALFDDLKADARGFAAAMMSFLGESALAFPEELARPVNEAAAPRNFWAAKIAKQAALRIRDKGRPDLVQRLKDSELVKRVLFRGFGDDKPRLTDADRERLRARFADDVRALDDLTGIPIASRWGYA